MAGKKAKSAKKIEELFTVGVLLDGMSSLDIFELRKLLDDSDFNYLMKTAKE